jgi:hypothetical protein
MNSLLRTATGAAPVQKPRVFVSYHHGGDRAYYEALVELASDRLDLFADRSVRSAIDSDVPEYVRRRIRENHIAGSSCTLVLCGAQTHERKFVDWEIAATLDKGHGLVAVLLPTVRSADSRGLLHPATPMLPARLQANLDSGYAERIDWHAIARDPMSLAAEIARAREAPSWLAVNHAPLKPRNG